MISIIHRGISLNKFIKYCDDCNTLFTYHESDEEKVSPPAIAYTIECPICKNKYVTRNYYKNGKIAFDNRKPLRG